MKKILTSFLALCLTIGFVGCGTSDTTDNVSESDDVSKTETTTTTETPESVFEEGVEVTTTTTLIDSSVPETTTEFPEVVESVPIDGEVGVEYSDEETYAITVNSYKYDIDSHGDTSKRLLVVNLKYKNLNVDTAVIQQVINFTGLLDNKYNYDSVFCSFGEMLRDQNRVSMTMESRPSTLYYFTYDDRYETYDKINNDVSVAPLNEYDCWYVIEIPDEAAEDNFCYKVQIGDDEYLFAAPNMDSTSQ